MLESNAARRELQPVSSGERVVSIDVLRGIAILGVLVAYTTWNLGSPPPETYGALDRVLSFILGTLLDTKAYTLLAFLFGLGFSIQMLRAGERAENIVPIYTRRLLALMGLGVAHSLLLRSGDILVPYATVGFVLLLFRNASTPMLVIGAIAGAALPFIARSLWELSGVAYPVRPDTQGMSHIAANLAWVKYWYSTAITLWPEIIPMFLCGLYVGRKRILENVAANRTSLKRILVLGLLVGSGFYIGRLVLLSMIERPTSPTNAVSVLLRLSWNVHAWGLAAFYGAAILLLLMRPRIRNAATPLAAVGRMSLTNYLLQSIIIVPVCVAFGLYDTITPRSGLLFALGVALFQVPFSVIWLKYFRFGPAEWLTRTFAYKRRQPMRRDPIALVGTLPVSPISTGSATQISLTKTG